MSQGPIRARRLLDARLAILLAAVLGLTLSSQSAFPEPASRAEALAALRSPDAAKRADAVVWIGNQGTMEDAELLHARLRDESALVRGYAEQGLWLLWTRSGDPAIDALMARGGEAMQAGRLDEAIEIFTSVIKAKPQFAEGWNQRATAYYLAGRYPESIADCREVLKRNPKHFGALAGMGQIHAQLENFHEALDWFRRALEVNPNMAGVEMNIEQIEERLEEKRRNSA